MTRRSVDGVVRDLTPEEETVYAAERVKRAAATAAHVAAFEEKEAKKASGKQKLLDLELSQAEIDALIL